MKYPITKKNYELRKLLLGKRIMTIYYFKGGYNKTNIIENAINFTSFISVGNEILLDEGRNSKYIKVKIINKEEIIDFQANEVTIPKERLEKYYHKIILSNHFHHSDIYNIDFLFNHKEHFHLKGIKIPIVLKIIFSGGQNIRLTHLDVNENNNVSISNHNITLIFDKKMISYKPNEIPIWEQFTWRGFLRVCGLSLMMSIALFQIILLLHNFFEIKIWLSFLFVYGSLWIFIFLFECLIPKLKGEK